MLKSTTKLTMLVNILAVVTANAGQWYEGFADVHQMPLARSDMTVSIYDASDGPHMYLIGGCIQDQVCTDPNDLFSCYCAKITNKTAYYKASEDIYVTNTADAPRARYRHAAAQVNGVIYLFGGRDINDNVIQEVDAYNISANTWTTPCNWSNAVSDNTAFVDGTNVFVTAGWTPDYVPNSATEHFNISTCTFTPRASLPSGKGDAVSVSVSVDGGNNKMHFVVGGFASDICNALRTVESYNVADDSWTQMANLTLGRADMALGVIDSHIFVIAGETINPDCNHPIAVDDVERLDVGNPIQPYTGNWSIEQQVPGNRFRFVGASYDNAIYLFGGQSEWTANLDGQGNGGFRLINTTMLYKPASLTSTTAPAPVNTSTAAPPNSAQTHDACGHMVMSSLIFVMSFYFLL